MRRNAGRVSSDVGATRLATLLSLAWQEVPYYAERVSDPTKLGAFPVLTRTDLRVHFAELIRRDRSGLIPGDALSIIRTGGSTGVPASHIRDLGENSLWDGALFSRMLSDIGAPTRGVLHDVGLHTGAQPLAEGYLFPPYSYLWYNFRGFFTEEMSAEALMIARYAKPDVVMGLPSRLLQYGDAARQAHVQLSPRVVISSYEQLTDSTRLRLEALFGCRVVNLYGSAEAGLCGWECREGRVHFESDVVIPEVLDDIGAEAGPGVVGNLVVTSCKGTVMPLIRYQTGDLAVGAESCTCGNPYPALLRLEGRSSARAVTRSGRLVSPYTTLVHVDSLGLPDYQVVQDEPGELRIITAPTAATPTAEHVRSVSDRLSDWAGEPFTLALEPTGNYVVSPSGKRNPFVSRVRHDVTPV